MAIDSRELRRCLGHFATGVTVVSCRVGHVVHGNFTPAAPIGIVQISAYSRLRTGIPYDFVLEPATGENI
jgi:hypothetical protein